MKRTISIIAVLVIVVFMFSGVSFGKSAGSYLTPPEGKTVNDPINKYSDVTYKELKGYMNEAQSKDSIMEEGAYQVNVCTYYLKAVQNNQFMRSIIRNIKPLTAQGEYESALLNAKFMQLMFVDVGNHRAANEMEKQLQEVVRFANRGGIDIDRIRIFLNNVETFYTNNFDIPEAD